MLQQVRRCDLSSSHFSSNAFCPYLPSVPVASVFGTSISNPPSYIPIDSVSVVLSSQVDMNVNSFNMDPIDSLRSLSQEYPSDGSENGQGEYLGRSGQGIGHPLASDIPYLHPRVIWAYMGSRFGRALFLKGLLSLILLLPIHLRSHSSLPCIHHSKRLHLSGLECRKISLV